MVYCEILKTNINVTSMQDTLNYIETHIDALRGGYICVSNVHTTVMAYENERYRRIQNSAAMALPDGGPLSKYSRSVGYKSAERVTGPDLMVELFRISGKKGYRHFFYGSTQQTLDDMRTALLKDYPNMEIAGMYAPPFRELTKQEAQEVITRINETRPDFVWVGLGAPKQEEWMYRYRGRLNAVSIGVGAGFDYVAGHIKRAPRIMQMLCLEWLYRLMQDPKRLWKRYVVTNTKFMIYICRERMKMKYEK